MGINMPFYGFPFRRYGYSNYHMNNYVSPYNKNNIIDEKKIEKCNKEKKEDEEPFFEMFGIKLYYDDLLILALLFFLYQEKVDDNFLFIALVLLLIS